MPPKTIGRYQVIELLGRGGMGEVYRAQDPALNRDVVLKLISLPSAPVNDEWRQRFKREVQAAGQLNHPHIVTVYDVDFVHEPPYVVMELLSGDTLWERLQAAPLPWAEALLLLRPLAEALAYAHRVGVIHRDVKPANVIFGGDDNNVLKLVDFGLARWQSSDQFTQPDVIMGTPAYMSPEQARGDRVDARTDIFALGIIIFEAIVGYNPLSKGSLMSTLHETTSKNELDLSPLVNQATPKEVIQLLKKACAKNREQRYATCEALLADLNRCLSDASFVSNTLLSLRPSITTTSTGPEIRVAANIELTTEVRAILRSMFAVFNQVAVEAEFGGGFGGSRVFRVRPVEGEDKTHLPAVVKIAPVGMIRQEWEAYQTWVEYTLPNIARLDDPPLLPTDSLWGGLRYALVGAGSFEVKSLRDYYQTANLDDLRWVLEKRLFEIMGPNWWWDSRANRTFQMQSDYDNLLPLNLLIKPHDAVEEGEAHLLDANNFAYPMLTTDELIQVKGFVITKVDPKEKEVTLNLPASLSSRPSASFRIRLIETPDIEQYRSGNVLDSIGGQVVATRRDLLADLADQAMGETIDLSAERLHLPVGQAAASPNRAALSTLPNLPNPLLTYQGLLRDFLTVKVSRVHGDLNMENILIDPATREVNLIDFATVHQGHTLHDLLRLETEVVIMLLPPLLAEAGLPAETIYPFYEQLHQATFHLDQATTPKLPSDALEKPFETLRIIRKMARTCLFNLNDWREYYQGLMIYLLGALKFDSLDALPIAPLPKQIAFLGAASVQYLLEEPPTPPSKPISRPVATTSISAEVKRPAELEPPFGTMHPDSPMYIERAVDGACLAQLDQDYAVTLFIQAPRQMGKSSLMRRVIEQTRRVQPKHTIFIDFQRIPQQYLDDEENLLTEICLMLGDALGLPEEIDKYWQGRRTNIIKCSRYVSEYIISQLDGPLILAMDEVERMLTSPFRTNFFGMLRTWHNDRAFDENFAKLTLFLSSSTEPYLFVDNPHQSPFNVAEVFTLEDFTRAEVAELNRRHDSPLAEVEVDALMELVNGHPFLTRLTLYLLASKRVINLETILTQASDDNGPFGDHLRYYLLRVLPNEELKRALAQICREQSHPENQLFHRLKGAGLIKKEGKQVVLRNKLYDQYFREHLNV